MWLLSIKKGAKCLSMKYPVYTYIRKWKWPIPSHYDKEGKSSWAFEFIMCFGTPSLFFLVLGWIFSGLVLTSYWSHATGIQWTFYNVDYLSVKLESIKHWLSLVRFLLNQMRRITFEKCQCSWEFNNENKIATAEYRV